MTIEQFRSVHTLRSQGVPHAVIAVRTGLPVHTVVNVAHGRVKEPGQRRVDAGTTRHPHAEDLIERCKEMYLQQGRVRGNMSAIISLVADWAFQSGRMVAPATLTRLVYNRAKDEKWEQMWSARKHKQEAQAFLPKLDYDTWSLVGYNDYWVIDGRKSDMWVIGQDGKPFMPKGFYIMELKTASYFHTSFSRRDFSAREVAHGLLNTALRNGPPRLGILCDNGMEQIGQDNVQMMEAFWPREIIEDYRLGYGIDGFHTIFAGARSPVVTSLPRIPTAFAKARLERSFAFLQSRFDAFVAGTAYQGGGRNDVVHTTLMRSPVRDGSWMTFDEFCGLMTWFLTAPAEDRRAGFIPYNGIERPQQLRSFSTATGMRPTIGNALQHCAADYVPGRIPEDNYWRIARNALQRFDHKRITHVGLIEFQHKGTHYAFACEALTFHMLNEHVDVALDPQDDTRAGIFAGDHLVGVGIDVSRRMNAGRITIAAAKEVMGELRKSAMRQSKGPSDGYLIAPPKKELLANLPAVQPLKAIEISVEDQFRLLDEDDEESGPEGIGSAPSEETRDLLSRISNGDSPAGRVCVEAVTTDMSPGVKCMEES